MRVYSITRCCWGNDTGDVVTVFSNKEQANKWAEEQEKEGGHNYMVNEHILDEFWVNDLSIGYFALKDRYKLFGYNCDEALCKEEQ